MRRFARGSRVVLPDQKNINLLTALVCQFESAPIFPANLILVGAGPTEYLKTSFGLEGAHDAAEKRSMTFARREAA